MHSRQFIITLAIAMLLGSHPIFGLFYKKCFCGIVPDSGEGRGSLVMSEAIGTFDENSCRAACERITGIGFREPINNAYHRLQKSFEGPITGYRFGRKAPMSAQDLSPLQAPPYANFALEKIFACKKDPQCNAELQEVEETRRSKS